MKLIASSTLLVSLIMTMAAPTVAQEALATPTELRIAAVGQSRVVMVQKQTDSPIVWEWTFLDEQVDTEEGLVDTLAISVMYDCAQMTRRALTLETYMDGAFVASAPLYEEPLAVVEGSLVHGALLVICEPETNMDGAAFADMITARVAMDARPRPSAQIQPQPTEDHSGGN